MTVEKSKEEWTQSAGAEMEKNNSKSQCDSTERMHYETVPLALQHYCNSWATQPLR